MASPSVFGKCIEHPEKNSFRFPCANFRYRFAFFFYQLPQVPPPWRNIAPRYIFRTSPGSDLIFWPRLTNEVSVTCNFFFFLCTFFTLGCCHVSAGHAGHGARGFSELIIAPLSFPIPLCFFLFFIVPRPLLSPLQVFFFFPLRTIVFF